MKKSIMKKWVQALRSGEYDQATGSLVRIDDSGNESFCCLGVLCNIATEHGVGEWRGLDYRDEEGDEHHSVLLKGIQKWSGMRTPVGDVMSTGDALTVLNDRGVTFTEIADIIEQNWEGL